MKKLIWLASIVACAAVFSLSGLHAATEETPSADEKPAVEEPTAVQPAESATQAPAPAGCPGMKSMPVKGHGKGYGPGCGMKQKAGCGRMAARAAEGCGMKQKRGCGMARGCGMMGSGCGMKPASPLTLDDARTMVESRLAFKRNPNLKMGDITDQGDSFEAEILTKDGSLVDKLVINKAMGWMRSIY